MARWNAQSLLKPVAGGALALALASCGGDDGGGGPSACEDFDCRGMLSNLTSNVMVPALNEFSSRADGLSTAVGDYCSALGGDQESAERGEAQSAWEDAMSTWQRIEVMPVASGAQGMRDNIYSWPLTNTCGVFEEVRNAQGNSGFAISGQPTGKRGLDALEYVLFTSQDQLGSGASCDVPDSWGNLTAAEKKRASCNYAEAAAQDVADKADSLVSEWDGTNANFAQELAQAGTEQSAIESAQKAVNRVSDALFYVEKQTKDAKLAYPAGIKTNNCGNAGTVCPEDVESPHSNTSKAHIRANLTALQTIFLGNEASADTSGAGFDDLLDSLEETNVSGVMRTDINNAITATEAIQGSLADAVQNNLESVESAHGATQNVTDRLKDEFLQVLGLSIPGAAAGDGD